MLPIIEQRAPHPPKRDLRACSRHLKRWNLARRLASDVHNRNIRPIPYRITLALKSPTQVHLFVIQEESRIEVPDLSEGISAE